ncbi:hypothetical protein [Levilactobacillus tongjiangensis]|uniref:S-layer protein n=1 Tax=Levilactobacillus tongjiangensis TaxID=2486023 RepID=A0ABW1SVH8_9LACO|nr:hypothetical protein [Levilactobacillus tongjiangensis]
MRSSFAKSIYVGAAVLGLAGLSAVTTTTASAKSYATAGSYTALTKGQNVLVNGTNAIYSKPGTVKGAKVVASKKTVAKLAASKKSNDTFYAYGTKTTNRGSVYYKIVTMDKKYRGYIYGGKTAGTFAGGIKTTDTMTKAAVPSQTTVYFANPGTANVTWTAPKNTDINAKKNVVNTTPFAGDKLTITDAATKTKEGSLYYYVKDATHPSVSGWIYSGAVTTDSSVAYNQASDVKVNLVATDGTTVKSTVLQNLKANNDTNSASTDTAKVKGTAVGVDALDQAKKADWNNSVLKGTGYTVGDLTTNTINQAALLNAKSGDTVTVYVTKGKEVGMKIQLLQTTSDPTHNTALVPSTNTTAATAALSTAADTVVTVPSLTTPFAGADGAAFTAQNVIDYLTKANAATLYTDNYDKTTKAQDKTSSDDVLAKSGTYTEYKLVSSRDGNYSSDSSAVGIYTATVKTGISPVHNQKTTTTPGSSFE